MQFGVYGVGHTFVIHLHFLPARNCLQVWSFNTSLFPTHYYTNTSSFHNLNYNNWESKARLRDAKKSWLLNIAPHPPLLRSLLEISVSRREVDASTELPICFDLQSALIINFCNIQDPLFSFNLVVLHIFLSRIHLIPNRLGYSWATQRKLYNIKIKLYKECSNMFFFS